MVHTREWYVHDLLEDSSTLNSVTARWSKYFKMMERTHQIETPGDSLHGPDSGLGGRLSALVDLQC